MQFIKPGININFIGRRKIAFAFSLVMILITIATLIYHGGLKLGIDFAGGTVIQIKFDSPVSIADIKSALATMNIRISSVQEFGAAEENEYLIRADSSVSTGNQLPLKIEQAMQQATSQKAQIRRVDMVGPQIGKDLREKALLAMFFSLLFITIYISGRFELKWMLSGVMAGALMLAVYVLTIFEVSIPFLMTAALFVTLVLFWFLELRYAMGAIVALIHDVAITVGIFSLFGKEFTLPIIAALLTIIGYSLNDTIIVFDRIRENLRKHHKQKLDFILNKSINETLGRTILTSMTTLIVLITLFVLGGGIIHDFAFAMIIGVLIGTYSSIFVASPILLAWQNRKK
ncbi:MAG: protein translocase subunit SecF [Deltaproteobacteria bacterium]|nr:protein translocase subunit SecF [Deltaproteobacteria bacterium]MBW2296262.1 protein translocase subunit SecF [Deltaproteobacteria bacterium]